MNYDETAKRLDTEFQNLIDYNNRLIEKATELISKWEKELEPITKVMIKRRILLDMNLIAGTKKLFAGTSGAGSSSDNARAYWGGKTPEAPEYTPTIEVVMKCPVKILEKVM
jgi:hypothetical protein